MNNILYIGPFKENNGLGRTSRRYINAFAGSNNINLAIRPVYFTQNTKFDDSESFDFSEFEENFYGSYDVVFQHGYPDMFEYNKNFGKNVGVVEIETTKLTHSGWIEKINMLDEVVVQSTFSAHSLLDSGVNIPIKIIPDPYDTSLYSTECDDFFFYPDKETRPFVFYTIGQYSDKKNIKGIVVAFMLEFNKSDNVRLFVKTGDYYQENADLEALIGYEIKQIQKAIRKDPNEIPNVDMLCGILKDQDIKRLHRSADCYINAVKADGFGGCAIEAMLCDKLVINTEGIGSSTYVNSKNALMVNAIDTNIFTPDFYSKNTFTIHEQWKEPDINSIRRAMREAYNMTKKQKDEKLSYFDKTIFHQSHFLESIL
jgi:glycosyltransferase involved in cell wall biosynthesis